MLLCISHYMSEYSTHVIFQSSWLRGPVPCLEKGGGDTMTQSSLTTTNQPKNTDTKNIHIFVIGHPQCHFLNNRLISWLTSIYGPECPNYFKITLNNYYLKCLAVMLKGPSLMSDVLWCLGSAKALAVQMDGWMDWLMYRWMDGLVNLWMDGCIL